MDNVHDLDALARTLHDAGYKLAVADPADLKAATSLLRDVGQDLIKASMTLGYSLGGTTGIKKIVADE